MAMITDFMGLCLLVVSALGAYLDKLNQICEYYCDLKISIGELLAAAKQALQYEHEFNRRAGISQPRTACPRLSMDETLPLTNSVYNVPLDEIKKINY